MGYTLARALEQSGYTTAATVAPDDVLCEIIVSACGHDGTYECEQIDTTDGSRRFSEQGMSLDEIERAYPRLEWWPLRDNAEWGEAAEIIEAGGSDGDEASWDEEDFQASVRDQGTAI